MMSRVVVRNHASVLVACWVAILLILALPSLPAKAAAPGPAADQLALVGLTTDQIDSAVSSSAMRIQAQVAYRLGSVKSGYLALFVFEDNANKASGQSEPILLTAGGGNVTLDIEYEPGPKIRTVSILVGMFASDKRLLGWMATNPLPLASLGGRLEFQEAMAARADGNNALAVERLSKAISLSPDAGSLYYWRADTLLRLGQYDDALADYDFALSLMPEHAASMVGRGIALVWKQQWEDGAASLSAALDLGLEDGPLAAWAHRARGVAFAAVGRDSEAVADYDSYLTLTPDAPDRAQVEGWMALLGG